MEYKILGVSKDGKDEAINRPYRHSARYGHSPKNPGVKAGETFKVKYSSTNPVVPPCCLASCEGKGKSRLLAKIKPGSWLELLRNFLPRILTVGHHNACRLLFVLA